MPGMGMMVVLIVERSANGDAAAPLPGAVGGRERGTTGDRPRHPQHPASLSHRVYTHRTSRWLPDRTPRARPARAAGTTIPITPASPPSTGPRRWPRRVGPTPAHHRPDVACRPVPPPSAQAVRRVAAPSSELVEKRTGRDRQITRRRLRHLHPGRGQRPQKRRRPTARDRRPRPRPDGCPSTRPQPPPRPCPPCSRPVRRPSCRRPRRRPRSTCGTVHGDLDTQRALAHDSPRLRSLPRAAGCPPGARRPVTTA